MSIHEKQDLISLWEQLRNDDHTIHTYSKGGAIISTDESYYDRYLPARITEEPQISSRIVGYTLCNIWNELGFECSVGDIPLFDRLNKLGEKGTIEITDRSQDAESSRRIFNVCNIKKN